MSKAKSKELTADLRNKRYREVRELQVDQLLEKIHDCGMDVISEKELAFLERAANEIRQEIDQRAE